MTYLNNTGAPVTVVRLTIANRPPGGTHSGGPYRDLAPELTQQTVQPGEPEPFPSGVQRWNDLAERIAQAIRSAVPSNRAHPRHHRRSPIVRLLVVLAVSLDVEPDGSHRSIREPLQRAPGFCCWRAQRGAE